VLRAHGKPPALSGYAGGTKRAWELASALWAAVATWGVDYALPPASFEVAGQRIRSAAQIADGGAAACMDLALLLCSALEQIGLHPPLGFHEGPCLRRRVTEGGAGSVQHGVIDVVSARD